MILCYGCSRKAIQGPFSAPACRASSYLSLAWKAHPDPHLTSPHPQPFLPLLQGRTQSLPRHCPLQRSAVSHVPSWAWCTSRATRSSWDHCRIGEGVDTPPAAPIPFHPPNLPHLLQGITRPASGLSSGKL